MTRLIVPALMLFAATVADARTNIIDIEDAPVPAGLGLAQVQQSIAVGALDRGWTPRVIEPGHIEATIKVRSHTVVVDITFDESAYSIQYKDSDKMDYKDGQIHRNYNRWVANLNKSLLQSLFRAATPSH